jgi:hypothetical protein
MGVYRANVNIAAPNMSPAVNVWHLRTDSDATNTAGHAMAQDAIDKLRAFYQGLVAQWWVGTTFKCDGITDVSSDEGVSLSWSTVTGTAPGTETPPVLAICVSWKTSIRARRGMGRTFLAPFNTGSIDTDGTITASWLSAINTGLTTLRDASLLDNGWAFGVYGQQNAMPGATSAERAAAPHVLRDFVGFSVKDKFAVMTSRRP